MISTFLEEYSKYERDDIHTRAHGAHTAVELHHYETFCGV